MNTTRQRPEEQYVMPVEASRRGAHRARVNPALGVLPFVAVAVLVVGVVALAWTLFSGGGSSADGALTSTDGSPAASAPAKTTPAAQQPAKSSQPAAQQSDPAAQPSQTAQAPAAVDKTLQIVVRNSTSTGGLAKGAANKLKAKGWTINGIPDNVRPTRSSVVFYQDETQLPSAKAVAKILGIALVKQNPTQAAKGITVVLGPDYVR